ncbi:hypothetical protein LTR84_012123 [Exophiala bonariae]|uniref:Zinc finger PHD-type domain-containing protein n=1 Tax=Exophiala bonariae TaxID=1690606 RepID=A0AAV9NIZ9_9EURO|nr:hypothetical protein LTR84_012123 [Exophiala bonariae]
MLNSSDQKTFRYIAGDFTFDDYRARWRERLYLERNLTRVLQHHQRRLIAEAPRPESRKEGLVTSAGIADNVASTSQVSRRGVGTIRSTTTSSLPIPESVVSAVLPPTGMAPHLMASLEPGETRQQRTKSLRSLRGRNSTTDSQSELHIDLNNIRKKLNFKTNLLDEAERSSKRQKRDAIKCKCHLTVWDSSTNAPTSIPKAFTKDCLVTATETAIHGCFVNIELESPFVIRNQDLMFTRDTKDGLITSLVDKYFMEIKIIPCRVNSQWPPIPLLGKSDGDNFAHDVKADFGELQGAVVARYMHLPQAPDADVPLSIFFLHGGRTYRTKYGLSVASKWTSAFSTLQATNGIDLESFREPALLPPTPTTIPRGVVDRRTSTNTPSTKITTKAPTTLKIPTTPDVHYKFIATSSTGFGKSEVLRRNVTKGYICPICTMWKSTKLVNLEFHLATTHAKYKWTVHNARQDLTRRTSKHILIECQLLPPPKKEERKDNIFAFEWHAPHKAFDLPAFLGGDDEKWIIDQKPQLPSIRKTVNHKKAITPLLPASQVPDFREPQRKKYAAVSRLVPHKSDKSVYTSVSHRPVSPSEEPRSETDDEIDNEWQIQQHLERLDIMAKKEGWSNYQRELRKRWDKHRMEEHLEHSTYLSNSLVRFVRKNRKWLSNGEGDLLEIFFDYLQRLKERHFIDDNVIMDVNEMIFNSPPSRPSTANNTLLTNGFKSPVLRNGISSPVLSNGFSSPPHIDDHDRELERALRPNTLLTPQKSTASTMTNGTHDYSPTTSTRLAKDTCGICRKPIKNAIKNGTFCTDTGCETARTMYHQKCVEINSARGISNGKGKAINSHSWICVVCAKRRHNSHLVAQEGHEEKGIGSTSTKQLENGLEELIEPSFEVEKSPRRPSGRALNASIDRNGGRFSRLS